MKVKSLQKALEILNCLIVVYAGDRRHQQYLNAALSFCVLVTLFFAAGFQMFLQIG